MTSSLTNISALDAVHLRKAVEAVASANDAIKHYNADCRREAQSYEREALALARTKPAAFAALVEAKEPGKFVTFDKNGRISGQTQFFLVFPVHLADPDLASYIGHATNDRIKQCKIHLR